MAIQYPDVTMHDVAREAHVAVSTVSRAFSRPGRVSASTLHNVLSAAQKLGYHHDDLCAEPVRNSRSGLIAMSIADSSNPLYSSYIASAQRMCLTQGYGLVVIDFQEHAAVERTLLHRVVDHVDGVILASSRMAEGSIRKFAGRRPLVVLNRPIHGVRSILVDPTTGIVEAVSKLRSLGHEAITYLAGPADSWQDSMRWRALVDVCDDMGLLARRLPARYPTYHGGFECVRMFLAHKCSAVIAFNDNMAIGFMAGLRHSHIMVPTQVSVIGCDDLPVDELLEPQLSTIRIDRQASGEKAVSLIVAMINANHDDNPSYAEKSLLVRRSAFIDRGTVAKRIFPNF